MRLCIKLCAFLNMVAGDLHTLLASLLLPQERLGTVCRRCFSHPPPLQLLLGGLPGEAEANQLALCPQPMHQQWEGCPRWTKSRGKHRRDCLTQSQSLLHRLLVKQFDCPPGWLFEICRSLWKVAWTILADTAWAYASFMTLSYQSISTLAAISVMETFTMRFLWSTAHSPILPFDSQ